jgi:hypothetical protein
MTRRHRNKEEVRDLIEKFYVSGMKRVEYCRQTGVGKSTLDRWLQKQGNPRHFVKVNLKQALTPAERGFALLLANGRRIEGSWQFGDSDLARLIRIAERV